MSSSKKTTISLPSTWRDDAACRDEDPNKFFPRRGDYAGPDDYVSSVDAKAVCAQCDVQQECRDYALTVNENMGIWGGLTENERRRLRRQSG